MAPLLPDGVRRLLRLSLRKPELIQEAMDEELRFHLEERTAQLLARGLSPEAARAEAIRRLGPSLGEVTRQLHTSAVQKERRLALYERLDDLRADIRYALRGLAHRPGFTALAVLTLAIGIGANTAIFSAVNTLLLRSLPFREPQALMNIVLVAPPNAERNAPSDNPWSWPKFIFYRNAQRSHADVALYTGGNFIVGTTESERVSGEHVSARYLATLGLVPAVGQDFPTSEDLGPGAPTMVLISDALWQRRFSANPGIVGSDITVNGKPYRVQGVLPSGFRGITGRADVLVPIATREADDLTQNWSLEFAMIGRLRPGVSPEQASSEAQVLGPRIYDAMPMSEQSVGPGATGSWGANAHPLDAGRVSPTVRRSLLVLLGAVGCVLLIACVNLANFLLGRAAARRREIGIRLAIGAGRGRLVRLLLVESFLLALLGGAASLLVAWFGTSALRAANPLETLRAQGIDGLGVVGFASVGLDRAALGFTLLVTLVVAGVFGLVPALQATRASLTESLKEGTAPTPRGRRGPGISRGALVIAEVALAVVLLAGSGLMLRSLAKLLAIDPGFNPEHVLTLRLGMIPGSMPRDSMPGFYTQLLTRLEAIPGVTHAGLADCPPVNGGCNGTIITFPDRPEIQGAKAPSIGVHVVTGGWFGAMSVPLLRGRLFAESDRLTTDKVIVISESAAKRHWPGQDPLGKRAGIWQGGFHDGATVIGVVGDVRFTTIDSVPVPEVYMPYTQAPRTSLMIFLRGRGDPATLAPSVRSVLRELAPAYPIYDVQPMTDRVAAASAQSRFIATLLALFAAVALALALMGIYGVMAFAVQQRTREIGIRMALGAEPGSVLRLVIGEGATLAAVGAIIGVAAALLLTRVMRSLLFEVVPSDPVTYLAIVAVLAGAALLASWLPARRASRVDPVEALRLG